MKLYYPKHYFLDGFGLTISRCKHASWIFDPAEIMTTLFNTIKMVVERLEAEPAGSFGEIESEGRREEKSFLHETFNSFENFRFFGPTTKREFPFHQAAGALAHRQSTPAGHRADVRD